MEIMNTITELKGIMFNGIISRSECRTIFSGILTESLLKEVNAIMSENGFMYNFGDYHAVSEDFSGFVDGNGKVWANVRYFGSGKPLYTWGILRLRKGEV